MRIIARDNVWRLADVVLTVTTFAPLDQVISQLQGMGYRAFRIRL